MYTYKINKPYKEIIPATDTQPEGALVNVPVHFYKDGVEMYNQIMRVSAFSNESYSETITRLIKEQITFYENNDKDVKAIADLKAKQDAIDEKYRIIAQAEKVDAYLASLN